MAIEHRSDPGGIKTEPTDLQRDLAAKGGPSVGLGDSQNRQVSSPLNEDSATQAAVKSTDNQDENADNDEIK
jgi:hypothetical protein